jgi:phosphopantothenoylcysteine decarboxylase/phosphopantothenate--cysteine ligase
VTPQTGIMGGAHNKITLIDKAGAETWDEMPKIDVARRLAQRIADALT